MTDLEQYKAYIDQAILAAEKASVAILEVYANGDWTIELKSDDSPLTIADKTSHQIIESILSKTGLPILSEEGKSIPYEERKKWNLFWLVDPLDGTKEFIKRNGEFTVNIALINQGRPIWGVVVAPVLNKTYFMDENGIAWLKEGDSKTRLKPARKDPHNFRVVASRSHQDQETADFIKTLKEPVLVSMGSSLKFMMLAEGKADVYPRFAPTMEWDTAASHAILSSLGYRIRDGIRKLDLEYNKENLVNPSFIAGF